MDSTSIFIRELCLVIWLGGLVTIDLIETPVRIFRSGVPREQATAIGGQVFKWFGWTQVLLGTISLVASISISQTQQNAGLPDSSPFISIAVILFITLIQCIFFVPRMLVLRVLLYSPDVSSRIRRNFGIVHGIYIFADLVKAVVGFWLLFHLVCARCQSTP
jgi:hypothetical protein